MVIASYLLDKAYEKGYAQGLAEGRAEAYKDADKQMAAYYKRMLDAREKGEDFSEPPPRFRRNGR